MVLNGFAPVLQDLPTFFFACLQYVFLDTLTHMPDVEQMHGVFATGAYHFCNSLVAVADKYRNA